MKLNSAVKDSKTKDRIILAAKEIFAQSGFEAASMSRIAKKAKLDKSSLYYFFKDKEDLFSAVTLKIWQQLGEITENLNGKYPNKSPVQTLSQTCQKFIKTSQKAGLAMTRMELPKEKTSAFQEIMDIVQNMQENVINYLKKYDIKDPEIAHALISNSLHAYVLHCRTGKKQPIPKKYCDYLSTLLISNKF